MHPSAADDRTEPPPEGGFGQPVAVRHSRKRSASPLSAASPDAQGASRAAPRRRLNAEPRRAEPLSTPPLTLRGDDPPGPGNPEADAVACGSPSLTDSDLAVIGDALPRTPLPREAALIIDLTDHAVASSVSPTAVDIAVDTAVDTAVELPPGRPAGGGRRRPTESRRPRPRPPPPPPPPPPPAGMLSASTEPSPETAVAVPQPGSAEMPIDLEDDAALARHLQAQEYTVYNGAGVSAFDDGAAQLQIIDVTDSPPPASPPALPSRPESAPLEILHYQPGQPRTPSSADMPLLHARQPPGQSTSSPDAALPTRLSPRRAAVMANHAIAARSREGGGLGMRSGLRTLPTRAARHPALTREGAALLEYSERVPPAVARSMDVLVREYDIARPIVSRAFIEEMTRSILSQGRHRGGLGRAPNMGVSPQFPFEDDEDDDDRGMDYESLLRLGQAIGPAVHPGLTADQIEELPYKKWREGMAGVNDQRCSICLEDYTRGERLITLPCRHVFHKTCISMWLQSHKECPICRGPALSAPPPLERSASASSGIPAGRGRRQGAARAAGASAL